jgi:signal transduction histidine kinase/CheY-like chemotaxis protein
MKNESGNYNKLRQQMYESQVLARVCSFEYTIADRLLRLSDSFFTLFEMEPAPSVSLDFFNSLIDPDDLHRVSNILDESIKNGTVLWNYFKLTTPNGVEFSVQASGICRYDSSGTPVSVIGTLQDISDQKKLELQLREAKEKAEEASEAKSMFLSNISHEIRTPMNAIVGLTELLLEEDLGLEVLENIRAIKNSTIQLLDIVGDILDYSKLDSGDVRFEQAPFDLHKLVQDLVLTQKIRASAKGIRLSLELADGVPRLVKGDSFRLNQILLNLLSNAIKFTEKGKISVTVETQASNDQLSTVLFTISDTGIGIPSDKIHTIYDQFVKIETQPGKIYGGTGMGLPITKHIIDLMGGVIQVQSKVGKGTKFSVELSFELVSEENISPIKTPKDLQGMRVLVVEDNEMNQFLMKKLLQKWNAEALFASDGLEAIALLSQQTVDIVIMDLQMPDLNGFEATSIIRDPKSKVLNHSVPILALTANALAETRDKALSSGFNDYISKPFDQDVLYDKMTQYPHVKKKSKTKVIDPSSKAANQALINSKLIKFTFFKDFSDDLNILHDIMSLFLVENPKELIQLKEMIQKQDQGRIQTLAHRMKSSLGIFGLTAIMEVLTEIENDAEAKRYDRMKDLITSVEVYCEQAWFELKKIRDGLPINEPS